MPVRFTARNNARRNPAKVPASLMTRAALEGVGKAYETGRLPPESNPDACVLWDMMHEAGCEALASYIHERSLALEGWVLFCAKPSREERYARLRGGTPSPPRKEWQAVYSAQKAWEDHPSGRNRKAVDAALRTAATATSEAREAYEESMRAGALRFIVIATLDKAGILPEPPPLRRSVRRNPAKVPVQLLTRSTLDAVGKAYTTQKKVPERNPDAAVLRDFMLDAGIEALGPEVFDVRPGAHLHRWIVQEAIDAAKLLPQGPDTQMALTAAKAWVADPSEANRSRAFALADRFANSREAEHADAAAHSAYSAAWAAGTVDVVSSRPTLYTSHGVLSAIHNVATEITFGPCASTAQYDPNHPNQEAHIKALTDVYIARTKAGASAVNAAKLRFRVLAALDAVGALPEPPVLARRNTSRR